jgi:hypothetical protein
LILDFGLSERGRNDFGFSSAGPLLDFGLKRPRKSDFGFWIVGTEKEAL